VSSRYVRVRAAQPVGPLRCKSRVVKPTAATWSAEEFWASDYTWDGEPPGISSDWDDAEVWSGADTWGGDTAAVTTTNLIHGIRITALRI